MNYESYPISSGKEWYEIIKNSPYSYFYQTPLWIKILEETFNYQNATRVYQFGDTKILVPLVKRERFGARFYSSIPFGYGGFLHEGEISQEMGKQIFLDLVKGTTLSLNILFPPSYQNIPAECAKFQKKTEWNYTHMLTLSNNFEEDVLTKFHRRMKKYYKTIDRKGIEIIHENSLDNFQIFYKIYANLTQKWGYKKPPHPLKFYENMCKFGSNNIQLSLAKKDDTIIGGVIILRFGINIYLWGSAHLSSYSTDKPTTYLYYDAIIQACNNGFKNFDLGESGTLNGVRLFKERFGGERINLDSFQVTSKLGAIFNKIVKF